MNKLLSFLFIFISTIFIFNCSHEAFAEDTTDIKIDISKNTNSTATCSKLLSPFGIQKIISFVFTDKYERHENDIIVSYKNLINENRKLNLELTSNMDELNIIIKKGIFKNLFLKINYKQDKDCNITGHLSWKGEEKRFSKSVLTYIIDHYFDKLMSFINRLA
jgi:hypothetical protein